MIDIKPAGFSIVIDTNSYSGNFEREMGSYITGQIGECGVGKENQILAQSEIDSDILKWFDENINQIPDEHGCCRPVSMACKNNGKYESVEIFFYKNPSIHILDLIKDRAKNFCSEINIKYIGIRLLERSYEEKEVQL